MAETIDWSKAFWVESRVADIISRQEKHGVYFDARQARWYVHVLTERILKIDLVAVPQMPPLMVVGSPVNKPFKKNGEHSEILKGWLENNPGVDVGGPFTRVSFQPFDLGKTGLFKDWLLDQGWEPDQYNVKDLTVNSAGKKLQGDDLNRVLNGYMQDLRESKSGPKRMKLLGIKPGMTRGDVRALLLKKRKVPTAPKITEESLESVDTPLGKLVMERMVWSHRRSLIEGLLDRLRPDGRLGAAANPDATPTHRMKHIGVVNIPAARSLFGKELRSLFRGGPLGSAEVFWYEFKTKKKTYKRRLKGRYVFVGYDGAGLELRMLAHYINDPSFTKEVVDGDIHTKNQLAAGLPTRDDAKTIIYCLTYGGGDAKLGLIVGGTSKEGARIREAIMKTYPGLAALTERIKKDASRGYLVGLDGRKLWMRRNEDGEIMAHKALNTLLQAAGAIVMKWAMVWLDQAVKHHKLRAWKVIDQHDEGQWECHPQDVEKLRSLMDVCVKKAGELLGLNCPLASDSIVGSSWHETH